MQIGDPKKALALAIVAIIILCVAVFRSIPSGAAIVKAATDAMGTKLNAQPPSPAAKPEEALPSVLTATPFVKPIPPAKREDKPKKGPKQRDGGGRVAPMPIGGHFADVSAQAESNPEAPTSGAQELPAAAGTGNGTPVGPGEIAGITRKEDKKKEPTLTLVAVLQVHNRSAIVNLNGDDSNALECHVGSTIQGYRVLSMGNSGLMLQKGKRRLKVSVGETTKL